jgi:hypothetical protein
MRFLQTAFLLTCRETAIPSREPVPAPDRASTLKQASDDTWGFWKTLLKSAG